MVAPLSHVRVLDMSRILAGPWAGQTLADLGAEVIKIERPVRGDDTRTWGPPFLHDKDGKPTNDSAYFLSANRGKKSVTLDISNPEGQAVIRKLAEKCDILIENYKVGGLAGYGLGYEDLKKINPGLIYCSITGFGPLSQRAGYDFLIQAMGGFMSITGEKDDKPGGGPQKIGVALSDILTGLYTTVAALSGLAQREKTGEGCHVDMALLDVTAATTANQALNYLVSGNPPQRMGNAHPNIVPYEAFAAADQYIIVAVGNDGQFTRFVETAGRGDLATDERFATNEARVANREILIPIIQDFLKQRPAVDWIADFEKVGVPCGPINDLGQVFAEEQIKHRGLQMELPHPVTGSVPQVANPIRMNGNLLEFNRAPPTLGQHTDEVLGELLGMDAAELAKLRDGGVI
jgi:crotonobetainyl-CoA:carnitine CoA-transferase CaiB-like acyl-CoA transferase